MSINRTNAENLRIFDENGNAVFESGTKVQGDFSNATVANRTMFQTSTTNSATALGILPNGTSTTAGIQAVGEIVKA